MKNQSLWTALITPMHQDGRIHFEDLKHLVKKQEEAGNGILLVGSTGEGLALPEKEKKEIVEFVAGLNPGVPLMAGVGGFDDKKQTEWISFCNRLNIDAFLLVTPLYAKPGFQGQVAWFSTLLDKAEKPCMLYNIPSRTGVKLIPGVLQTLENHRNLWSVKEASGSVIDFQQFRMAAPKVSLFSGDDALMPYFQAAGCKGLVSVAANIWPEATKLYVEKCLCGNTETLLPVWPDAVKALFSASNPIPAKHLLKEKGLIQNTTLRLPLTENELTDIDHLVKADQQIQNWYNNNK